MALKKQNVPVLFSGALDTKSSKQTAVPGSFLVLENAVRRKTTLLQKRNGFWGASRSVLGTSEEIDQGRKLHIFNRDLLLLNDLKIYSYSSANNAWMDRGAISSVRVASEGVVRNGGISAVPDVATKNGLTAYVYESNYNGSYAGVYLTIVDNASGASVVYDYQISTTGVRPKVVATRTNFVVTYVVVADNEILSVAIPLNNPSPDTVGTPVVLQADVSSTVSYDVSSYDTGAVFAYRQDSTGDLRVGYITETGAMGAGSNGWVDIYTDASFSPTSISVQGDAELGWVYVAFYDASTFIFMRSYNFNFTTVVGATIDSGIQPNNLSLVLRDDTDQVDIYYDYDTGGSPAAFFYAIKRAYSQRAGGAATLGQIIMRQAGLWSKGFYRNGSTYIVITHESDLQPTYFLMDQDGIVQAKLQPSVGGGLTRDTSRTLVSSLCSVVSEDGQLYRLATQTRSKLTTQDDGTVLSSHIGITGQSLVFDESVYSGAQLGQNLHIAGGILRAYDGVSAVEHGFQVYPEQVSIATTTGGNALPAGVYTYAVVYEWVDGRGQIHQSAPSTYIQSASMNGTTQNNTLTIPTLTFTQKTAFQPTTAENDRFERREVSIVIYRSEVGLATVLYRLGSVQNNPNTNTVTYKDTIITSITGNEILYTVGDVLENIAAPACSYTTSYSNRIFLFGLEDGLEVGYSREQFEGEGVAFSDFLRFRVDSLGGAVTSGAVLDDKVVIFKRDSTFVTAGVGPTDAGTQIDYGVPQLVSGDVGCVDPDSIARTTQGIMFKSAKGIYLLSRSLELVYIGAPVESFNAETITSAVVVTDVDEVRFTTQAGNALVYNYYFNQWSTFTNYEAESAVLALGSYCHLKEDGTVNFEDSGYEDNGRRIKMALETSWLAFGGLQGYQRVYMLAGLGDFKSHHIMKLKLAYDYENAYTDTVYFNTSDAIANTYYGEGYYGEDVVYGGVYGTSFEWQHKPMVQKCEAIKIRLEDLDTIGVNGGASADLVSLTFTIGIKEGTNKLGASSTIGD